MKLTARRMLLLLGLVAVAILTPVAIFVAMRSPTDTGRFLMPFALITVFGIGFGFAALIWARLTR